MPQSYVITGASRGIGLEWIRQLSADPSNLVFALVRNPDSSAELTALASERPETVHIIKADVSSPQSMVAAASSVGAVLDKAGAAGLDVLVHNAVAYPEDARANFVAPSKLDPSDAGIVAAVKESFEVMLGTAIYGTLWTTNAFLPLLEKAAGGVRGEAVVVHAGTGIADINFTLVTGVTGMVPYCSMKSAMALLSTKYAIDLEEKNIKVVSVSPGWVNTSTAEITPESMESFKAILAQFQRAEPTLTGPISTKESVEAQINLLGRIDNSMVGRLVSHHGNHDWF